MNHKKSKNARLMALEATAKQLRYEVSEIKKLIEEINNGKQNNKDNNFVGRSNRFP